MAINLSNNRLVHLPTGETVLVPNNISVITYPLYEPARTWAHQYVQPKALPLGSGAIQTARIHGTEFYYVGEYRATCRACFGEAFEVIVRQLGIPKTVVFHFYNNHAVVRYQADHHEEVILPIHVRDIVFIHDYNNRRGHLTVIVAGEPRCAVVSGWIDPKDYGGFWDWVYAQRKPFVRLRSTNRDVSVFSTFRFECE